MVATVKYKMYVRNLDLNISMTAIDKKFDEVLIKKTYHSELDYNA